MDKIDNETKVPSTEEKKPTAKAKTASAASKPKSAAKTSSAKKTASAATSKKAASSKTTASATSAKTNTANKPTAAKRKPAAKKTAEKPVTETVRPEEETPAVSSEPMAANEIAAAETVTNMNKPTAAKRKPAAKKTAEKPVTETVRPEEETPAVSSEPTAANEIAAAETVSDTTAQKSSADASRTAETNAVSVTSHGETFAQTEQSEEDKVDIETVTSRSLSPTRLVLKRFFRSKLSMAGLVMIIVLFAFSFLGPCLQFLPFVWGEQEKEDEAHAVITEYTTEITVTDERGEDVLDENGNPVTVYVVTFTPKVNNLPPSGRHLLGTDSMGFDVFSRLMYGGRISLTIGFVVVILETLLGVLFGGLAGYFGKWVDQVIMRVVDVFNCIPTFPMLMIVGVALQQQGMDDVPRLYTMMAMLTLFGWSGTARLVRGQILSLREQEFMLSAEASGLPVSHKIIKHLIPNVMPQLIVSMTLGLGGIILTEATLGYLGIGLPNAYATWGNMISGAANNTVLNNYPNMWISPGICIILAVLAFNFIGDGLRDAFDPKSSK